MNDEQTDRIGLRLNQGMYLLSSFIWGLKMVDYAYTTVTGKIKDLLNKVRTTGVPTKLTIEHLKVLGFTSSNDKTLIGVMKFIGLVDQSGIPTSVWSAYRGGKHKTVLADAI